MFIIWIIAVLSLFGVFPFNQQTKKETVNYGENQLIMVYTDSKNQSHTTTTQFQTIDTGAKNNTNDVNNNINSFAILVILLTLLTLTIAGILYLTRKKKEPKNRADIESYDTKRYEKNGNRRR
jgi:hypothetical protein